MIVVASDVHRGHEMLEVHHGEIALSSESPVRADTIADALRRAGHDFIEPSPIDADLLRRVHDPDYIDFIATAWDRWVADGHTAPAAMAYTWPNRQPAACRPDRLPAQLGWYSFSADTSIVEGTYAAVEASAAIAMTTADRVIDTGERVAYGLCRPPGHHASGDRYGGYCFVNNATVAAQRLRDRGVERVGILDVDYHHGNGTQDLTEARDDIVFASIHACPSEEFPWFSGFSDEVGTGAGVGCNLNVALPKGTSLTEWFAGLQQALDFLAGHQLGALVVSLGVDVYEDDPLGTFALTTTDFAEAARRIASLDVPMAIVQEGGYATDAIGDNVAAFLSGC